MHPETAIPSSDTGPPVAAAGGLGLALLAYQQALNLVPFPDAAYVPANLALTGGVLVLAHRTWGLGPSELGLEPACIRPGVVLGAAAFAAVGAGLLVAHTVPAAEPLLSDARVAGLDGAALAFYALVRIPFGTAIPEETIFRGALFGALQRRLGWWRAAAASSALFGLWHLAPTTVLLRENELNLGAAGTALALGGAVVGTALAGIGFCLLRRWGRGLLAPILAHWATNSLSLLAAVATQRGTG